MKIFTDYLCQIFAAILFFASGLTYGDTPATSAELIAKAPVLQVLLDNSGSSPATDQASIDRAWPIIEKEIRALPIAGKVLVFTVGDASAPYSSAAFRIQKRMSNNNGEIGGPVDSIVEEVREIVTKFPTNLGHKTIATHGNSQLVKGLYDAAKLINLKSDLNVIIFVSDLIEFSPLANCYKQFPCKLPAPTFKLTGTKVTVLGVGMGFNSDRQLALNKSWETFFTQAATTGPVQLLLKY